MLPVGATVFLTNFVISDCFKFGKDYVFKKF